jgi:hypothetical protein
MKPTVSLTGAAEAVLADSRVSRKRAEYQNDFIGTFPEE